MMEEVYSRTWFLEKRGGFKKCKGDSNRVWGKVKYRSKEMKRIRYNRGERL